MENILSHRVAAVDTHVTCQFRRNFDIMGVSVLISVIRDAVTYRNNPVTPEIKVDNYSTWPQGKCIYAAQTNYEYLSHPSVQHITLHQTIYPLQTPHRQFIRLPLCKLPICLRDAHVRDLQLVKHILV